MMTNQEFANKLAEISGLGWHYADLNERELRISVTRSNYGNPSSAVIEFVGSPVKFQILMGDLSIAGFVRPLYVHNKWFRTGKRCARACRLIEEFLIQHNAIEADL
jgi:hypothetical protein